MPSLYDDLNNIADEVRQKREEAKKAEAAKEEAKKEVVEEQKRHEEDKARGMI